MIIQMFYKSFKLRNQFLRKLLTYGCIYFFVETNYLIIFVRPAIVFDLPNHLRKIMLTKWNCKQIYMQMDLK